MPKIYIKKEGKLNWWIFFIASFACRVGEVQLFIRVPSPNVYVGWMNSQGCLPSRRGRKLFLAMSGIKGILQLFVRGAIVSWRTANSWRRTHGTWDGLGAGGLYHSSDTSKTGEISCRGCACKEWCKSWIRVASGVVFFYLYVILVIEMVRSPSF